MNTKYNELEEVYEVDLKNTSGAELLAIETPNKYVTYAGLERAVRNVLSKAKDYDKGLAGGYNGTFPLTAATKGNIYLLPATKKYYICIKDYSGSQLSAPNSNFEELSVYANRSKLDNLIKVEKINVIDSFTNSTSAYLTKIGNICMLRIDTGSAIKNDTTLIGKVMQLNEKYSKYYPSSLITVCAGTYSDGQFATFSLHTNGNITINRGVVSKDAYYITFVYSVDI